MIPWSAAHWHSMTPDEVLTALQTSDDGLSEFEARSRLDVYGRNDLVARRRESAFSILANQFRSIVVLLLIAAIGLSAWAGEEAQTFAIAAVLILNVGLGFYTEFRAREAISALLDLNVLSATVVRESTARTIASADLVPGDVILCEAGQAVPADARLLHSEDLSTIEASLTGESEPSTKQFDAPLDRAVSLPDRVTMVYKGTFVAAGTARAVVTGTGKETEIGRIEKLVESVSDRRAPLEKQLDSLGGRLAGIAVMIGGAMALLAFYRGSGIGPVLQMGIAVAVSAVPEGLPAVVIITIAIAAHRMARKHAVVRRLPSVETLGSVTVVCTDKTGTLTAGRPAVTVLWVPDREVNTDRANFYDSSAEQVRSALLAAALANRSMIETAGGTYSDLGDPYEVALLKAAHSVGLRQHSLLLQWPVKGSVPFSSSRMMMASFHEAPDGGTEAFVKGAPHRVVDLCTRLTSEERMQAMDGEWRTRIEQEAEAMAARGLRVMALARGSVSEPEKDSIHDLEFLGLVGMTDPIAPGVPETIATLRTAGIRTVMLTGDHAETARTVAALVGIDSSPDNLVSGASIDLASDEELKQQAGRIAIAGRVSPEGKLRLLSALQSRGEVVAMLGDGINDAAALKQADIGVAMGKRGTDVAKEVAGIVLANDDFNVIAVAVQEGRLVFDNIRKFVFYLFSCNMGEIIALFSAVMIGLPMPMTALQILWLNLVTDTVTALSLAGEKPEASVMTRPPRRPGRALVSARMIRLMTGYAALIGITAVAALIWGMKEWPHDTATAVTLSFTTLSFAQIFHLGNARRTTHVLSLTAARANRFATAAVLVALALQVIAVTVPPIMSILDTRSLSLRGWVVALMLGGIPAIAGQTWKWSRAQRVSGKT